MITIIFSLSCLFLSFMLLSKIFEIKVRKIHFLSNLFKKGDHKIHDFIERIHIVIFRYKKIARIFIFDFVPAYCYELLVRMKDYVSKKYYEAGDNFRGRRILKSRGSVSFFLEKLAEEKPSTNSRKV